MSEGRRAGSDAAPVLCSFGRSKDPDTGVLVAAERGLLGSASRRAIPAVLGAGEGRLRKAGVCGFLGRGMSLQYTGKHRVCDTTNTKQG